MACTPSQDPLQQLLTCVGNSLQHGRRAAAAFLGGAQQHLRNHMQPLHASNPAHSGSTESPATVNSHSLRSTAGQTSAARVAPLAAATLHTQLHPGSSYVRSHSSSGTSTSEDSEVRKAELGRATWTLLHMMAAQYPERPSRQQQRDAAAFINTLARVYPCGSCGAHFQEILRRHPPAVRSKHELQQWMCSVHNVVNQSLGKPAFNCDVAGARWSPLECGSDKDAVVSACDMTVAHSSGRTSRGTAGHHI